MVKAFGDNITNPQLMAIIHALAQTTQQRGLHIIHLLEEANKANEQDADRRFDSPNGFITNEEQVGPISVPDYQGGHVKANWIHMASNYQVEATQGIGFPTYYVNIYAMPCHRTMP